MGQRSSGCILKKRRFRRLRILTSFSLFKLICFDFFDSCPQIQQKAALIFFGIGEILYFFFPNKIVDSRAIFLIDKSFSSKQYTIARDYVQLMQDNEISWDQLMRRNRFESCILVVDQMIFLIFDFSGLFMHFFDGHFKLPVDIF